MGGDGGDWRGEEGCAESEGMVARGGKDCNVLVGGGLTVIGSTGG